jgi:hypothetical protein
LSGSDLIGLVLGLGGTLVTVLIVIVTVVVSLLVTALSLALPFGILYFLFQASAKQAALEKELLATGASAPATIAAVGQTGMYINNQPQVQLVLEVIPPDGAQFTAKINRVVSLLQIPQIQPGRVVEVRYDKANPSRIMVVGL